jgi:hypothetical protein
MGLEKMVHAQDVNGRQSDYPAVDIVTVDGEGFYMRGVSTPVLFENFVIMWSTSEEG